MIEQLALAVSCLAFVGAVVAVVYVWRWRRPCECERVELLVTVPVPGMAPILLVRTTLHDAALMARFGAGPVELFASRAEGAPRLELRRIEP